MIIIKNSQLDIESISALNSLIDLDIPANLAFRLMRIIKEVSSIVDDKVKMERRILEKFSEKDENGTIVQPKDEQGNVIPGSVNITNMEDFSREMSDLMEIENEVPYEKINFDDLNLQTAKVKDLIKLEFLFN